MSWKSKEQSIVSKLSIEIEYRSMTFTVSELVWLM